MQSVLGTLMFYWKISAKRENILGQKHIIMRRNVSDDGDMFKETKLLLYFRLEHHGYATKTGITYAKEIILAVDSETFCCSTL